MRLAILFLVMATGASIYFTKGLESTLPGSKEAPILAIEPESVADYCTRAIPQIWQYMREAGEDGMKEKLGYIAFNHVATGYCICNQERLGENRSDSEKALFGKLAGLNLKMGFSQHFTKSQRKQLNKESQKIGRRHRSVIERSPAWLKTINNDFRQCRKEQILTAGFSSISTH